MTFSEALSIPRGITAIIGSGGKTSLMYRLAEELQGSVILCTSTLIFPPPHIPVAEETGKVTGVLCVGSPGPMGKLAPPKQSFRELASLADYVLVEADGSKHLPLKAHAPHEPVIPEASTLTVTLVGASGIGKPTSEAVHRPELFYALTGSKIATPEAVALALEQEALGDLVLINQADSHPTEAAALARLLHSPVFTASLSKGEILCSY